MQDYPEIAMRYFKQGYNCAQSVMAAFSDRLGIEFDTAIRLASSFGGGMGRLREVCGAVSGMFMAAGILYGYGAPGDKGAKLAHYKLIQELAEEFKMRAGGSIICRELLGKSAGPDSPIPEERSGDYYSKRPCVRLVGLAAELVSDLIAKKEGEPASDTITGTEKAPI